MLKITPINNFDYYVKENNLEKSMQTNDGTNYFSKEGTAEIQLLKEDKSIDFDEQKYNNMTKSKTLNGQDKKMAKDHQLKGYDLTFSAPKDFSLLVAGADDELKNQLEQVFRDANRKGLEKANTFLFTRKVINGEQRKIYNANNEVATFYHDFSREQDMQKHGHNILTNESYDPISKTHRAVDFSLLMRNQKECGLVFQSELARGLRDLGFEIEPSKTNDFSFEIKGISQNAREEFSKRHKQIIDESEKNPNKEKSLIALETRKQKGILDYKEITQKHKEKLKELGLDEKSINSLRSGNNKEKEISAKDVVEYTCYKKNSRAITEKDIKQNAEYLSIFSNVDKKELDKYIKENGKKTEIKYTGKDGKDKKFNAIAFTDKRENLTSIELMKDLFKGDKKELEKVKNFADKKKSYFEKKEKMENKKMGQTNELSKNLGNNKSQINDKPMKKQAKISTGNNASPSKGQSQDEVLQQMGDLRKSIQELLAQMGDPTLSIEEKAKIYSQAMMLSEQYIALQNQLNQKEQSEKNDFINSSNSENSNNQSTNLSNNKSQKTSNKNYDEVIKKGNEYDKKKENERGQEQSENKTELKTEVKAEVKMEMAAPGGMSL
jgi:conjugative relaxase-like TrwC/TraI family protein